MLQRGFLVFDELRGLPPLPLSVDNRRRVENAVLMTRDVVGGGGSVYLHGKPTPEGKISAVSTPIEKRSSSHPAFNMFKICESYTRVHGFKMKK